MFIRYNQNIQLVYKIPNERDKFDHDWIENILSTHSIVVQKDQRPSTCILDYMIKI